MSCYVGLHEYVDKCIAKYCLKYFLNRFVLKKLNLFFKMYCLIMLLGPRRLISYLFSIESNLK